MSWRNELRFAGALLTTNLHASLALRGAFLLQALFMLINNAIFFSVWWILFARFPEVNGWHLPDLTALFAIVSGGWGVTVILAGGTRDLAKKINDGELDAFLTQPKNALWHVLGSRSSAAGWGDALTAVILLALSGYATWAKVPLMLALVISGAIFFIASAVMIHCLAFWVGGMDSLARQMVEFVITFSIYPQTIFSGFLKLLLFTVIPAGFIGFLPVELLRQFRWEYCGAIAGAAVLYTAAALAIFYRGLRRYESGSRFGVVA